MAELMNSLVPALGYALLHFLWQGALIGLLAASALIALRRARPQVRYMLACMALSACALVSIATVIEQFGADATSTLTATPSSLGAMFATGIQAVVGGSMRIDAALPWVVALWALGACLLSLRVASGVFWIQQLRATPQVAAQVTWQARLDALVAQSGMRRSVALRLVDALDTPASAGWWRPAVLLPTALITRMPVELLDALLAHELAHIRRHDYLVNLMQNVVEALLFYHPVVWWLSRQIRDERELIADQLAATATGAPRNLALALSELAEMRRIDSVTLRLAQAARSGRLFLRIQRLIRPETAIGGGRLSLAFVSLAAACIAVHAAGASPIARETLEDIVLGENREHSSVQVQAEMFAHALASADMEAQAADATVMASEAEMLAAEAETLAADEATRVADEATRVADEATRVADGATRVADEATRAADEAAVAVDNEAMAAEVQAMLLQTGTLEIAQDQMHAAAEAAEAAAAQAAEAAEMAQDAAAEAAGAAQETGLAIEAAKAAAAEAASAAASEATTEAAAAQAASQAAMQQSEKARARAEADVKRRSAQENEQY